MLLIPKIWQGIDFYRENHHGIPTLSILGHFNTWLDQKHSYNGFPEECQYFYADFLLFKNGYTNSQLEKEKYNNIVGNIQVTHIFHTLSVARIKRIELDKTLNCIFQNI